jgi:peptide/nickel transport system substrate-binding protein
MSTLRLLRAGPVPAIWLGLSLLCFQVPASNSASADGIRIAIQSFPTSRGNPLGLVNTPSLYTFAALFDALTYVGQDGEAKPLLATSWQVLTPTLWQFELRDGVTFSNGEPFNAGVVQHTFQVIKSDEGQSYVTASELAYIKAVHVVDDLTVQVETEYANPFLAYDLSMLRYVPTEYWQSVGAEQFALDPVGTTPYVVDRWTSTELHLLARADAWRQSKADRLTLLSVPSPTARVQALLSDRVHAALLLGPDETPALESVGHRMAVQAEPSMIVLAFNLQKESPLRDVRVRRALNYAVNKSAIVEGLLLGQTRVATQTAPEIAFGFDPELAAYPYDVEQAKALLAEAGYPNGFDMVAEVLNINASFAGPAYQQVAADLAAVGVQVELRAVPTATYAKGIHQGQWGGEAFGIDYGIAPSLDALRAFVRHSCLKSVPWYCDEDLMPLLREAMGTFDLKERQKLTRQVLKRQRDQAPAILLFDYVRFDGVHRNLKGYANHVGYIPYHDLFLAP